MRREEEDEVDFRSGLGVCGSDSRSLLASAAAFPGGAPTAGSKDEDEAAAVVSPPVLSAERVRVEMACVLPPLPLLGSLVVDVGGAATELGRSL